MENNNNCHDCGKEVELNGEEVVGGVCLGYDTTIEGATKRINIIKCDSCYAKSPALTNFQPCEVYSRVVGYIRPVQQWHKGKRQEYGEREEFKVAPGDCNC